MSDEFWDAVRQREADLAAATEVFRSVMSRMADEIVKLLVPSFEEFVQALLPLMEHIDRLAALDGEDYIWALNGYDDE